VIDHFWRRLKALQDSPRVLECGTRTPDGCADVSRRAEVLALCPRAEHLGLDAQDGPGVDVVADLHRLPFGDGGIDAVLICSVLEHVRRPWVVAQELGRVTRSGGLLYCQTHFLFPRHSHPCDYFRFTPEGLCEVFSEDAGWRIIDAGQEFPALVIPTSNEFAHSARGWNFSPEPGHLNTWLLAERI
jgi:SAM-dependent methyltransferase